MFTLDPTWLPFSNLMLSHIYNVLLICNDYDRFLLEEDGRSRRSCTEYTQLGLSNPPKISPPQAVKRRSSSDERDFELVIAMLDLGDESVERLAEAIKEKDPTMPVIVLSPPRAIGATSSSKDRTARPSTTSSTGRATPPSSWR